MSVNDTVHAFVKTFELEGARDGPLAGLRFAAKDIFDVAGEVTGCGNPDWARTHAAAAAHAAPVSTLLAAGATLIGKTHTDELAYSLMGVNAHYGTPVNPAAPARVPGGSSAGSAAATAAGLVEIGLGSDTGGSVRLPASFCGLYGFRPTHGAIAIDGTMPLAPSFDTVGWFARDPGVLARVGEAFGLGAPAAVEAKLILPVDLWSVAEVQTVAALQPAVDALQAAFGSAHVVKLAANGLEEWREAFRIIQAFEIWQSHGDWITRTEPAFGPGVRERFEMASRISTEDARAAGQRRAAIKQSVRALLLGGGVFVIPTSPAAAPYRDADPAELDVFRTRALELLAAAGLGGLPQISIPAGEIDGAPIGLSLVGAAGADNQLLSMAMTRLGF